MANEHKAVGINTKVKNSKWLHQTSWLWTCSETRPC